MECSYKCEHVIAGRNSLVQEIRATLKRHGCYCSGASLSDVITEVAMALDKKDKVIKDLESRLTDGHADPQETDGIPRR